MSRSFKAFTEEKLLDRVRDDLYDFINENFDDLKIESRRFDDFEEFDVCDMYQKQVYVDASFVDL